ncbi:MAG: proline--tRNA ligase [bacterium]|nr:proline--tRNA ligase [bacterium]
MRMSKIYAPTLKEDPVDAEIASHKLLLRAAMIRKVAAGVYNFLPLGFAVLQRVEDIIREEMQAIGSQEIRMSALQPAELWHESGRWNDYGPELMRLVDRNQHGFCLGPTHEELITSLVRDELRSYKELPKSLFQIQVKFRDEIRPRFGLLRAKEFVMKDAYSFHPDQASLQEHYDEMGRAYGRICDRTGLDYRPVAADSGQIGGKTSVEYMALAEAGEAAIVFCECGYAADVEAATATIKPLVHDVPEIDKISTPGVGSIASLSEFLGIPEAATVKALIGKGADEQIVAIFVPGDHDLNNIKICHLIPGFDFLTDDELVEAGLHKGSIGPVGLPEGIKVLADESLKSVAKWVCGANEDGFHYVGAKLGADFQVDEWADLCNVFAGDFCPECGKPLDEARGIEVSQIFQLGTKYSDSMGATYMDEDGVERPFVMGCYGVGVTRTLAAVVEQHNDEHGIIWPVSVAPAEVCVVPLAAGDDIVSPVAEQIATELNAAGLRVAIDDRNERAGVKFNDADLIGWPYQIVVGKRGVNEGIVEIKERATGEKSSIAISEVVAKMVEIVEAEREKYAF